VKFGVKGARLTRDDTLVGVTVITADEVIAILDDTSVRGLGTLMQRGVTAGRQVLLLAADAVTNGHTRR
jgi:hypothetical protein